MKPQGLARSPACALLASAGSPRGAVHRAGERESSAGAEVQLRGRPWRLHAHRDGRHPAPHGGTESSAPDAAASSFPNAAVVF